LFSYQRLQVDQFPDVTFPVVVVQTDYPGAAPESVESELTRKIEEAVNSVSGLRALSSRSYAGTSLVVAEFDLTVDPMQAAQDVREKVAAIRAGFRREVKEPKITRFDPADRPIISFAVTSTGARSLRELTTLADQVIKKRLENVRGVGQVNLVGGVKREVQIYLKPAQLEALAIGVDQVINAIRAENQELPLGALRSLEQERVVQIQARAVNPADFNRIVVARRGGQPITLAQIATVVDGEQERESAALIDDRETLALDVLKAQGQNTIEVAQAVATAAQAAQKEMPPDVKISVVKDAAIPIRTAVRNVTRTMIEGALLTILIVFLFLGSWRSTVITGLTLPIATIGTFLVMYAFGFTLNVLTLMALSLCIGLLIDDAIVVRENIVRHSNMGKSHRDAALQGTQEIGVAVMATTFAILAVFIPVAFMSGIIGRFFLQFGITVAVAVLVSLFVSFTLDPMLSSIWPDPPGERFRRLPWLGRFMERVESVVERAHAVYDRVLNWTLSGRRYARFFSPRTLLLGIAGLTFIGSFMIVPLIGTEFVPQQDEGMVSMRLNTPIGSSLEYTDAKIRDAEAAIREIKGVDAIVTTVGTDEGKNYARLTVVLADRETTKRPPQTEYENLIRERLTRMAGLTVSINQNNRPVSISLLGPDRGKLTELSQELLTRLAKIPGIADLESSEKGANPTIAVRINNELASDLGLTTAAIGNALRPLIAGDDISTWLGPDGQDYDVIVQLPKHRREIASDLGDLYVASTRIDANGAPMLVPLRQVAEFVETGSPQQIKRLNLQRRISIYGNAQGRASGDVGSDAERVVKEMKLPPGYRFDLSGGQQEMNETFSAALAALGLAVIFIYLVLASQFGSFMQPIAIMVSLPLSLIGVLLALLFTGTTLNIFSIIGFIMLMGLVTKNAILLVDFTNQALRHGRSLHEAIREAGQVRLRPILMTTMAMIFGMLPMAIGVGQGGEMLAPMGRAVIGGVITSTVLTLLIVPVLYTYLYRLREWVKRLRSKTPVSATATAGETGAA
jgi:HAE1 family hydrophobic/amphiphilic exporter-1